MLNQDEVRPSARIVALDVIRGIAILGTLASNIWIFAATSGSAESVFMEALFGAPGQSLAGEVAAGGGVGAIIHAVLHLITDGKFLGLLTIMFGIGLEIQRQSFQRRGKKWPGRYYRRAALLAAEGLINYTFVFEFDVLMGYGLTALAVAPILARSERVQKLLMWSALVAHVSIIVLIDVAFAFAERSAPSDRGQPEVDIDAKFYDSTASYWEMVRQRVTSFAEGRTEIPILFVMGLAMFLIGARLYRAGLFDPAQEKLRKAVMAFGLGVGIPLDWGLRLWATGSAAMTTRYVTSAVVAFGLLALIAEFYARRGGTLGGIGLALANVGKTALSCYILQNLLASIVFYDFGLGLGRMIAGQYETFWVIAIYFAISGVLLAFSALWLRRFERGPVELVMHKLY
ncbi:DUF418 domain-containing protein [Corynebacterium liangguodongii]|nr:DUF418 domain-containing protein [Corynebacterium liangguodongii]